MVQTVANTIVLNKPILLENQQPGPTVFTEGPVSIEWAGHGDTSGGDIQAIPMSLLENINFLRILTRGILSVFDASDEVKDMIEAQLGNSKLKDQAVQWRAQQNQKTQEATISIEQVANHDLVAVRCIGPGSRQGIKCDVEIPVRELNVGEKPPLCETHKHLAKNFVPTEGETLNSNGKAETIWVLPRIESRKN